METGDVVAESAPANRREFGYLDCVPEELLERIGDAHTRYHTSYELGDLDELLELWRVALAFVDAEELATVLVLRRIVLCLKDHHKLTEDATDLNELIATLRQLLDLPLEPHSQHLLADDLHMLAHALLQRYALQKDLQDLEDSIPAYRLAVDLDPDGIIHVEGLIAALRTRGQDLMQKHDIDEAIKLARRVLESVDTSRRAEFLVVLAYLFHTRYRHFEEADDLDTAITTTRMAAAAGDSTGPLMGLGLSLYYRFSLYGELSDLDLAITLLTSALELDPVAPDVMHLMQRLAAAYKARFIATGRSTDIDEAVILLTGQTDIDRQTDEMFWNVQVELADCYRIRFYCGNSHDDSVDIDKAIELLRVMRESGDAGTLPSWYLTYGQCLMARASRLDDAAARHEMISVLEAGARHVPKHDDLYRYIIRNLATARSLALIHDGKGLPLYLFRSRVQETLMAYVDAVDATYEPLEQLRAMLEFSRLYAECHQFLPTAEQAKTFVDPDIVKTMHSRLLDRMPEEIWLGHTLSRRYKEASKLQSAVSASVATAFLLEDEGAALEWFEQGRAVVWSQIQNLRTPLDDLRQTHSDLAERLERLSSALEDAGRRAPLPLPGPNYVVALGHAAPIEEQTVTGRRLAREHKELLKRIRSLDGFQSFLDPRRTTTLLKAADNRAIACINLCASRSDALIIVGSNLHHVRLPKLTPERAGEWHARLTKYLQWERARTINDPRKSKAVHQPQRLEDVRDVLREMWVSVVWPILEVYLDNLDEGRAHLTWCTTGQLAFLPLHAAGPHDGESLNALDLVVSSYAPNLSCLLPSTTEPQPAESSSILVVAQPSARDVSPLPGTVEESKKVAANFPNGSAQVLLGKDGTIEAVLDNMAKHPYIHLACHGKQDADPTKSAFFLDDGELTLHALMAHKSSNAQLAFLSACETATGDATVPNEAVHLAAGMLAAGYKSVVATMWSIGDTEAPRVADEFYKALLADPERNVAFALHTAVQKLREHVGVDQFVKWMPFIHLGV